MKVLGEFFEILDGIVVKDDSNETFCKYLSLPRIVPD